MRNPVGGLQMTALILVKESDNIITKLTFQSLNPGHSVDNSTADLWSPQLRMATAAWVGSGQRLCGHFQP